MVVWQRPNLLVLDEPTNHLDLEMRHALEMALQGFEGALILVSHDRHLLRNTVEELLLVHEGSVQSYEADLASYEQWILSRYGMADAPPVAAPAESSRREQRQAAAARREQLRPLKQRIAQTERELTAIEEALAGLQALLADPALYSDGSGEEVADLLQRQGQLKTQAAALEESWLEQQQALEELEASDG